MSVSLIQGLFLLLLVIVGVLLYDLRGQLGNLNKSLTAIKRSNLLRNETLKL